MSNYWVRIENSKVVECLSSHPGTNGDWREAIEIVPEIIPGRQIIEGHEFDITKNPVEVLWKVKELSINERKQSLLSRAILLNQNIIQFELNKEFNCSCNSEDQCCIDTITEKINKIREKRAEINTLSSHEEIDNYNLEQ